MKDNLMRQNKNIEKFCEAVFLVLDNSKLEQDLRLEIDREVMSLVTILTRFGIDRNEDDRGMTFIKDINKHIDIIMSLMSFLTRVKKVEEERFNILRGAGIYIKDKLNEFEISIKDNNNLAVLIRSIKDTEQITPRDNYHISDNRIHTEQNKHKFIKKVSNFARVKSLEIREGDRKGEILKILSNVPISIKDISSKISGCSEKTIQRELNNLVDIKKVSKFGDKRWSRYALYAH